MSLANGCKVWLALGADLLDDVANWTWTDVTAYVLYDGGAGVQIDIGYPDGSDEASPTRISFTVTNADGRWSPTNPAGAWFGQIDIDTPVKVTFNNGSGDIDRAVAYLADLPLEWTTGGKFRYVHIDAYGLLARLDGADSLDSNAYRWTKYTSDLVAYWSFEDDSGATRAASAVAGQPDGAVFNVGFGSDPTYGGSKPLPVLEATSTIVLTVAPYARPYPEAWSVCMAWRIPARPASTQDLAVAVVCDTGAVRKWVLRMTNATPSVVTLRAYNSAGTELLSDAGLAFDSIATTESYEPFGDQLAIQISAAQNGTGIDWSWLIYRGHHGGGGSSGTLAASTLGPVSSLVTGGSGAEDGHTVGHYCVFASATLGTTSVSEIAGAGVGDLTIDRFAQQGVLSNVPVTFGASVGEPMGPVPTDTLINVLREADRLERGLLWEDPEGNLRIRSREDLINRSVGLTLAYATQVRSLQPTSAVRDYVNRVTVNREGGSSATVDATGPLSPTTRGVVRSKPLTVNSQYDTNLRYYAQWDAAVGTCPDYRYAVELQFHGGASAKLNDWLALSLGDRVQITSPPAELPPDTIDGYLRGYSEHINRFEYTVNARLLPSRPYQVFTVEGSGNSGRADTSGSRLLAPITTSATSAIVGTYGNPGERTGVAAKWSTTSLPYDLALRAAERVTCTAVTNNAPTFVAAGAVAHADNAAVTPGAVSGITAGDCELLICSIRDSGGFAHLGGVAERIAIYVGDQAGWKRLASFGGENGNFAVYARTYQTSVLTPPPTLTPVVGSSAAGDTVSAQLAAFRNLQPIVHNGALPQQNASAQDIAYPGLGVVRNGSVVLIFAQKDDDWTSVASPAGFTEIGEPDSTLGSDQGLAWYYQIQTTATQVASGSLVVTGGASATSKATTLALLGDVQTLTLTRNVNAITGGVAHPVGAEIGLWRGGVVMRP
jgi:hypothetical protein